VPSNIGAFFEPPPGDTGLLARRDGSVKLSIGTPESNEQIYTFFEHILKERR